jgi:membrane protein
VRADPARVNAAERIRRARVFARRVYEKAGDDNIFFLAGAISFNVLVAIVPLLLFTVGVVGFFLSARFSDPASEIVERVLVYVPAIGGNVDLVGTIQRPIEEILASRRGFTLIGAVFLVWFSTRLVGTLRTVLREVFDVAQDRGMVGGKIFDIKAVIIGGALIAANLWITTEMEAAGDFGISVLGIGDQAVSLFHRLWTTVVVYLSAWVLFIGLYRYLPVRWIPWPTAFVAATFAATFFELLKYGFSWYVTEIASYGSTYGNLLTMAVLFFWIYYSAIVFILGGEIAQVWTMRRALRATQTGPLLGE